MAVISKMPNKTIVDGFKGTIDFYVHKGQACARTWPQWYLTQRAPAVQASGANFAAVVAAVKLACPEAIAAAEYMASGTPMTWKDIMISIMLGGTYVE